MTRSHKTVEPPRGVATFACDELGCRVELASWASTLYEHSLPLLAGKCRATSGTFLQVLAPLLLSIK